MTVQTPNDVLFWADHIFSFGVPAERQFHIALCPVACGAKDAIFLRRNGSMNVKRSDPNTRFLTMWVYRFLLCGRQANCLGRIQTILVGLLMQITNTPFLILGLVIDVQGISIRVLGKCVDGLP